MTGEAFGHGIFSPRCIRIPCRTSTLVIVAEAGTGMDSVEFTLRSRFHGFGLF